ncbi:basic proline-rich protein-like [Moschus berezovskii]|uniref:basic proline-rich protein-like n=1 Tax=Moschus berezovskii TaxID=68408 RepID=UPI002443BC26|nr:basic proline-rich protein-like [Moschus berezovskii]
MGPGAGKLGSAPAFIASFSNLPTPGADVQLPSSPSLQSVPAAPAPAGPPRLQGGRATWGQDRDGAFKQPRPGPRRLRILNTHARTPANPLAQRSRKALPQRFIHSPKGEVRFSREPPSRDLRRTPRGPPAPRPVPHQPTAAESSPPAPITPKTRAPSDRRRRPLAGADATPAPRSSVAPQPPPLRRAARLRPAALGSPRPGRLGTPPPPPPPPPGSAGSSRVTPPPELRRGAGRGQGAEGPEEEGGEQKPAHAVPLPEPGPTGFRAWDPPPHASPPGAAAGLEPGQEGGPEPESGRQWRIANTPTCPGPRLETSPKCAGELSAWLGNPHPHLHPTRAPREKAPIVRSVGPPPAERAPRTPIPTPGAVLDSRPRERGACEPLAPPPPPPSSPFRGVPRSRGAQRAAGIGGEGTPSAGDGDCLGVAGPRVAGPKPASALRALLSSLSAWAVVASAAATARGAPRGVRLRAASAGPDSLRPARADPGAARPERGGAPELGARHPPAACGRPRAAPATQLVPEKPESRPGAAGAAQPLRLRLRGSAPSPAPGARHAGRVNLTPRAQGGKVLGVPRIQRDPEPGRSGPGSGCSRKPPGQGSGAPVVDLETLHRR